jgi:hypothetical protein
MIKKVSQLIGSGVIYVNVPKDLKEFYETFASATGYSFRSNAGLFEFIHWMVYKDGFGMEEMYVLSLHIIAR